MERFDEIKAKFKDLGVLAGADVVWLLIRIKDLENQLAAEKSDAPCTHPYKEYWNHGYHSRCKICGAWDV